jgi:hypothetical protein
MHYICHMKNNILHIEQLQPQEQNVSRGGNWYGNDIVDF